MSDAPVDKAVVEPKVEDKQPMDPKQHEMLLEIMKKKSDNKDLKAENDLLNNKIVKFEADMKLKEEDAAKAAGNFQDLYAKELDRNNQLIEANAKLKEQMVSETSKVEKIAKMYAVEEHIQFARPHYKKLFNVDEVRIGDDGKIDSMSLNKAIDAYKQEYPETIVGAQPKVNPTSLAPKANDKATGSSHDDKYSTLADILLNQ